ncbi:MAG: class I SAM-dependent methyltransferase [Bacteriovoracales bacterium]|nr:class I SAM-dependent methyltransferase [Bacteriovoracales bacterium]
MDAPFSGPYLKIAQERYKGLNLTGIKDAEAFHVEQFLDSVAPLEKSAGFCRSLEEKKLLVDVGFGGGFPLLPLAFTRPGETFVGFEGTGKKVRAVRDIASRMGIKNVSVFHHRIENILIDLPCLITFKALGSIEDCLGLLHPTKRCRAYFYKGPRLEEKEGAMGETVGGWQRVEDVSYDVGGRARRLLGFEREGVPCGTPLKTRGSEGKGLERKNLVKLSSLF